MSDKKITLDIDQFMAAAREAEGKMNQLQDAHDRVAPAHEIDDADVAAVNEELRKAGFDPDAMEDAS
jgi:hypothetical protein